MCHPLGVLMDIALLGVVRYQFLATLLCPQPAFFRLTNCPSRDGLISLLDILLAYAWKSSFFLVRNGNLSTGESV